MFLKYTTVLFIAAASVNLTTTNSSSQTFYENDNWTVAHYKTSNDNLACYIISANSNPKLQYLANFTNNATLTPNDRGAGRVVLHSNADYSKNEVESIRSIEVSIDNLYKKRTRGVWYKNKNSEGGRIFIELEDYVDTMVKPLSKGKNIRFKVVSARDSLKGKELVVPLKDSYQAFVNFERCLATIKHSH